MTRQLNRLALMFGLAFLAVALASGYWGVVRADALTQRGDNPRRVLEERRSGRGQIVDRNGAVLASTGGAPGALTRRYAYPDLAPVVGYVSAQFGAAGIEAALDGVLHGDAGLDPFQVYWQTSVLGAPPPARDVRLSIDLRVQRAADAALGGHMGALVLLDAETGEILALASHPTYDANRLEADWPQLVANAHAPLLNRATLALYQPGAALWPVVVAQAIAAGSLDPRQTFLANEPHLMLDDHPLSCRSQPATPGVTLAEALRLGCPGPVAAVGQRLGAAGLGQAFAAFQLFTPPGVYIPTTAATNSPTDAQLAAAVGQASLTVTPLQVALITAAITRGGQMPAPQLVLATQDVQGAWKTSPPSGTPRQAISATAAESVREMLAGGYVGSALTSNAGQTLAWYSGFKPADDTKYVVAVLLEDGDLEAARQIGEAVLAEAGG